MNQSLIIIGRRTKQADNLRITFISWKRGAGRRLSQVGLLLLKLIRSSEIIFLILAGGGRNVEVLIILVFLILNFCLSGSCAVRRSTFERVPLDT